MPNDTAKSGTGLRKSKSQIVNIMDLTTTYLGLKLRTPLVPAASPLSEDIDNIKRMEDAGARRRWCCIPCSRSNCARTAWN